MLINVLDQQKVELAMKKKKKRRKLNLKALMAYTYIYFKKLMGIQVTFIDLMIYLTILYVTNSLMFHNLYQ